MNGDMRFATPPRQVGWVYIAPGYCLELSRWPCWLHRTMTRLLLGWRWVRS